MFFRKPDPERDRYYLLAGMGKRLARQKKRVILRWTLVVGVLTAAALTFAMYFLNRGR
jgi:hypothetical protein